MKFFFMKSLFCFKFIFLSLFFLNASSTYATNSTVTKINVLGEQRLSESFIKKFVPDLKDGIFDDQNLNILTKKLFLMLKSMSLIIF